MVDLFKVSDPSEALGNTITAREILDRGAERIETELANQLETQARLMDTMGSVYTSLGLYDESAKLLESSLETRKKVLDANDPEIATTKNHLAKVLGNRGDFDAAYSLYKEAHETRAGSDQAESLDTATSLSGMAEMLMEQGKYSDAEPLYLQALELRRKLLGESHPDIAESLQELGFNYFKKGEFEQAVSRPRPNAGKRTIALLTCYCHRASLWSKPNRCWNRTSS
jgi:serine/threonine-protein kinase